MEESSTAADAGWVEEREGVNLKNHGLQNYFASINKPQERYFNVEIDNAHQILKNKNLPWDRHPHFHLFHQVGLAGPKEIQQKKNNKSHFYLKGNPIAYNSVGEVLVLRNKPQSRLCSDVTRPRLYGKIILLPLDFPNQSPMQNCLYFLLSQHHSVHT